MHDVGAKARQEGRKIRQPHCVVALGSQRREVVAAERDEVHLLAEGCEGGQEIGQVAGLSEGTIYNHFRDKAELLDAVVQDKLVNFQEVLESLPLMVGQNTVSENLAQVLERAYEIQVQIVPFISLPFADQELLVRSREILKER